MQTRYNPEEVEFVGGPLDGQVIPFTEWARYVLGPGETIYLWRDDNKFRLAHSGTFIKRVQMLYMKNLTIKDVMPKSVQHQTALPKPVDEPHGGTAH